MKLTATELVIWRGVTYLKGQSFNASGAQADDIIAKGLAVPADAGAPIAGPKTVFKLGPKATPAPEPPAPEPPAGNGTDDGEDPPPPETEPRQKRKYKRRDLTAEA